MGRTGDGKRGIYEGRGVTGSGRIGTGKVETGKIGEGDRGIENKRMGSL